MHFSDFCNAAVLPVLLALVATAQAQSACASSLRPTATPKLAAGWEARLVANGLTTPRGIIFDSAGRLIISQQGNGLVHLALNDGGGTCISVSKKTNLISNNAVGYPLFTLCSFIYSQLRGLDSDESELKLPA
jgi:glucose/arabinose dehydrogenase